MAKVGISASVDVTKILKQHIHEGAKGKYLDLTMFVDLDQKDQYDNNGMITQNWKDQQKGEGPILGNCKVFWSDGGQKKQDYRGHSGSNQKNPTTEPSDDMSDWDSDKIPF